MSIINIGILKQFLEKQYARHLVFKTNNLEILLVCWLPGQGAEAHEHGQSDAITLVLEGEMSYTTFHPEGSIVSGTLRTGDIEHIPPGVKHRVMNNSNEKLVTLHIYSPPLEASLLCTSLGYANKIKLQEMQLPEKTIRYLMADKTYDQLNELKTPLKNKEKTTSQIFLKEKSNRETIVIIGGGFSGTLVATHLMKNNTGTPLQIMLIERAPRFARGFAYSTNSPLHLLNVPAGKMSAFPDDPDHFLRWVQNRDLTIQEQSFVPRMLYGEYLEAVLHDAEVNKSPKTSFKRLNDEAVSIEPFPDNIGATINLESGIKIPANRIVLAVGNYLPRNPSVSQSSFYQSKRYVRDPWSSNALTMISPDDPVLLVGTGLTMIDKAVELKCRGHRGIIHAISRHGNLPQPHNTEIKHLKVDFEFNQPLTVKSLLHNLREKVKSTKEKGGDWRLVIDSLRPHVQNLWSSMSIVERKRFFRHVRPYWDVHRHRIPPQVATIINSMLESKQLLIHSGRIKEYEENESHVNVTFQKKGSSEKMILQIARIINCTGSELDFCQIQDPLVINLFEQGLIAPDKLALGLDATSNGALKDKYGNTSNILYTLGPPLKGQLWETTAVPEIREQAITLAEEIVRAAALLKRSGKSLVEKDFNYII